MRTPRIWRCVAVLVPGILAGACGRPGGRVAESFRAEARVLASGSVDVDETLVVRFSDAGATTFERRVDLDRADDVTFVSATLDGDAVVPGNPGARSVAVEHSGRRLRVVWTVPAASNAVRAFGLRYQVQRAVEIRENRGTLRIPLLPDPRSYVILSGHLELSTPDDVPLLDGSGIAEAGWTVARTANGLSGERSGIPADQSGTFVAELGVDRAVLVEPTWQGTQAFGRELVPAFVSGGLFILVIGIGVFGIIRFQYGAARGRSRAPGDRDSRESVRTGLRNAGLAAMAVGAATAGLTWMTLSDFGMWPQIIPASILCVGVAFAALGRRMV